MANQVPYFHHDKRTGKNDWKPNKALRAAGWRGRRLSDNHATALIEAIALNEEVRKWREAGRAAQVVQPAPRLLRLSGLVRRYRDSQDYCQLKPATQREYDSRLRALEAWGLDGEIPVRDINRERATALARELRSGSLHRAGAILRVARLLFSWAGREGLVDGNPFKEIGVPEPRPRSSAFSFEEMDALESAMADGREPGLSLAIPVAFWSVQRRADLLAFNKLAWRPLDNIDPRDAEILANRKGDVMGFRLQQRKTGAWVDAPLPPWLHAPVETAFEHSQWLFASAADPAKPIPDWQFNRHFTAARDSAVERAIKAERHALAEGLAARQFRDFRRTGMMFYRDAGADNGPVTALSGHAILGRKSILDTYMPPSTAAAVACVAIGVRAWNRRLDRQRKEQEG